MIAGPAPPRRSASRAPAADEKRLTGRCTARCVVRVLTRLNFGGPTRHVAWLTDGLRRAGLKSVLVAGQVPPGEDDMSHFVRAQGVHPLTIPGLSREISWRDAPAVWRFYRILVRLRPDIVHTHTAKAGTVGRLAGLLYRWLTPAALLGRPRPCRIVHTYHGHVFHSYYGPLKTRALLGVERLLARLATDRIVVISPQQYREIHERFGVGRPEQFVVIPLGLDLGRFGDWRRRRGLVRAELGAGETDVLVGIVGRLTEVKNHRLFLETAAHFKRVYAATTGARVRFVVIGNGHLRPTLQQQARRLELADDVTFLGLRDDPENFYPALDVLALTSLNEGTPLTIIEGMANRRAVIAAAVGGVVDLLGPVSPGADGQEQGYSLRHRGVSVVPNDAAAFCRGLNRLVQDRALRQALGRRGRAYVVQNLAKERLIDDVLDLYEKLLEPRTGLRTRRHTLSRRGPSEETES
jgi:glycosyltransferase involved in cell wall biosynthesis